MTQLHLQNAAEAREGAAETRVFEKPRVPVIAIMVVIILSLNSAFGDRLGNQAQQILAKIAEQRSGNIGAVQGKSRGLQKAGNHKHLMDLVRELRKQEKAQATADTNATDTGAVWLKSVSDQGESIAIEGMATTPSAVAKMISDLQSTGYFTNIEIKETYQDNSKNKAHAFKFQITCEVDTDRS
jgi:Tfp pilus assembly protein PilN